MAIAGVLMIHDEAKTVARAVESFGQVCDSIIGLDVGSTDGAVELARDLGVDMHAQEWTTHGAAAETLLRLARDRADYALLFGATETVEQVAAIPDELDAPVYLLTALKDGTEFQTCRMFRSGIDWTCPGPVHSTVKPDFFEERRHLPALRVTVHDDDGRRPEKLERYRVELEEWLKDHPGDSRSLYYLAQSYYFLGHHATAGGLYALRARMSDTDEEAWHSLYMAACCEMTYNADRGMQALLECWRRRPNRMEPLHIIEQVCHQIRQQTPLPTDATLFVLPEAYLTAEERTPEQVR